MGDSLEASLRYPMDFTFHIQNFSAISYAKTVKSKQQATVAYSFIPADAFAGRPIGLTINLNYRDAAGTFLSIQYSMKLSKLLSLMKVSTLKLLHVCLHFRCCSAPAFSCI